MSEISELESRITTALERINAGISSLTPQATGADNEAARLQSALDEERVANAQLEERVRAIKDKQDGAVEDLRAEVERLRKQLDSEESAMAKLRNVNADLRNNNDALRTALSAGVAEPHLINKSMMAELEGVRAAQVADRAELDAVLGELDGLIAQDGEGEEARVAKEDADA